MVKQARLHIFPNLGNHLVGEARAHEPTWQKHGDDFKGADGGDDAEYFEIMRVEPRLWMASLKIKLHN